MVVEAKGSGKDRDEALKDAFRDAVRKVVGAYVQEDTIVQNDQVIKDQVLTYSGGCVKDHGIVADYKDGSITIWALVEQDKVIKRLKAASVSVKEVAGGKIWDEIQSKRWKEKEAEAMLRSALKGFPANCMKAEVVGEPKYKDKGSKIQATVNVQFSADEKAFDAFRDRLLTVLDHIAKGGHEFVLSFEKGGDRYSPGRTGVRLNLKRGMLCVNTSRNELWTSMAWKSYELDERLSAVFQEIAMRKCECALAWSDKNGKTTPVTSFSPRYRIITTPDENLSLLNYNPYGQGHFFFLAPTFVQFYLGLWHEPNLLYPQEIDMTESEVKNLKSIRCELRFSESGK